MLPVIVTDRGRVNNIRQLFGGIYRWLTAPLYARLARELDARNQEALKAVLEAHEQLVQRVNEEVLRLHINCQPVDEFSHGSEPATTSGITPPVVSDLSDYDMVKILRGISNASEMLAASRKHGIPLGELILMERRYGGMDVKAVKRVKRLERYVLRHKGRQGTESVHVRPAMGSDSALDGTPGNTARVSTETMSRPLKSQVAAVQSIANQSAPIA